MELGPTEVRDTCKREEWGCEASQKYSGPYSDIDPLLILQIEDFTHLGEKVSNPICTDPISGTPTHLKLNLSMSSVLYSHGMMLAQCLQANCRLPKYGSINCFFSMLLSYARALKVHD
jgi:hypothetical protein